MTDTPEQFDAAEYWETRHARFRGSAVSVGNIGLSDTENRLQIREKTRLLAERLLALFPEPTERRLLDAGCGIGVQTRELGELGFAVVGIDFSKTAVEEARKLGGAEYQVADLGAFEPEEPFDICTCIDVLYHLVNDEHWRAAIESLARSLLPGGYLFIVEHFPDAPSRSPHVVWRTLEDYRTALEAAGLELVNVEGYTTSRNRAEKALLTARRRA